MGACRLGRHDAIYLHVSSHGRVRANEVVAEDCAQASGYLVHISVKVGHGPGVFDSDARGRGAPVCEVLEVRRRRDGRDM